MFNYCGFSSLDDYMAKYAKHQLELTAKLLTNEENHLPDDESECLAICLKTNGELITLLKNDNGSYRISIVNNTITYGNKFPLVELPKISSTIDVPYAIDVYNTKVHRNVFSVNAPIIAYYML